MIIEKRTDRNDRKNANMMSPVTTTEAIKKLLHFTTHRISYFCADIGKAGEVQRDAGTFFKLFS